MEIQRLQTLPGIGSESCFIWGPRQTGKSTLLAQRFPGARRYDLLRSDQYERFVRRPGILREELAMLPGGIPVVIDEVQKVPALLDEVHSLIVETRRQFILCGSSARRLRRGAANLLGGRALRYELYPLCSAELPAFDLVRAANHGLLPRHYLAESVTRMLRAYVGDYLREEIAAEAATRSVATFGRFLEAAAFSNGDIVNASNIARECGVSPPTVREYFQILEDTLIGRFLPAFIRKQRRRVVESPRFYFFDVGVVNALLKRQRVEPGAEIFGRVFEHLVWQELCAHRHYSGLDYDLSYWRTASQLEVDFILGDADVAIEVKATREVGPHHVRNLRSFMEEYRPRRAIVVSLDPEPREVAGVEVLPWRVFTERLWSGTLIS